MLSGDGGGKGQDLVSMAATCTVFWAGMVLYMYAATSMVTVVTTMNLPLVEYNKKMDKTVAYMHKLKVGCTPELPTRGRHRCCAAPHGRSANRNEVCRCLKNAIK